MSNDAPDVPERQWKVPVSVMCAKHLNQEVEFLHRVIRSVLAGKSIAALVSQDLVFPSDMAYRLATLVSEQLRRGMRPEVREVAVDSYRYQEYVASFGAHTLVWVKSANELENMCPECEARSRIYYPALAEWLSTFKMNGNEAAPMDLFTIPVGL